MGGTNTPPARHHRRLGGLSGLSSSRRWGVSLARPAPLSTGSHGPFCCWLGAPRRFDRPRRAFSGGGVVELIRSSSRASGSHQTLLPSDSWAGHFSEQEEDRLALPCSAVILMPDEADKNSIVVSGAHNHSPCPSLSEACPAVVGPSR